MNGNIIFYDEALPPKCRQCKDTGQFEALLLCNTDDDGYPQRTERINTWCPYCPVGEEMREFLV